MLIKILYLFVCMCTRIYLYIQSFLTDTKFLEKQVAGCKLKQKPFNR